MRRIKHSLSQGGLKVDRAEQVESHETAAAQDMKILLEKMKRITERCDQLIKKQQQDYNHKQMQYHDAYKKFQDSAKYKVSDTELKKQRKNLQPYENNLRNAGYELDRAKEDKRKNIYPVLQQMLEKKDVYEEEQAELLRDKALQLQKWKKQYMDLLREAGDVYAISSQIDEAAKGYEKMFKDMYKNTVTQRLNRLTEDVPLAIKDLEITEESVKKALKGNEKKEDLR